MSIAIVFDLDDTLYPERAYNFSGFRAVGQYVLARYGVAGFAERCIELYEAGLRGRIFDAAISQSACGLEVAELVTVYREHLPEIALFEDARELLARLHTRVPLGLLTDGYAEVQRRKVAALGIGDLFAAIVYSDDQGREAWKPSRLPYERLMQYLTGKAEEFVYVGDNPNKDFVTARKLGWRTVMVQRAGAVHQPAEIAPGHGADLVIGSLAALPLDQYGLEA